MTSKYRYTDGFWKLSYLGASTRGVTRVFDARVGTGYMYEGKQSSHSANLDFMTRESVYCEWMMEL